MKLDNKTLRNIFFGVAGCIFLYWILHETDRVRKVASLVGSLLAPFVVGAAIAFIFNVPMRFIEKYLDIEKPGLRRAVAIVFTLIAMILVIALIFNLLIPQLRTTVQSLLDRLPAFFGTLQTYAISFLNANPKIMDLFYGNTQEFAGINFAELLHVDWSALIKDVLSVAGNSVSTIVGGAFSAIGSVSSFIVNAVISIVFSLYCLSSKEKLARQLRHLVYAFFPEYFADETIRIMRLTNTTFSNFISGQCLEAVILGGMFAVTMFIFKMPYVALVSVIISVTALVPLVGAFVGCFLGAFFILVDNPMQAVWFVVMFLVLQQIEGNLIYPKVVGTSIGLPGMWVLVAVSVGGELMGIGGMFIMIPVASVLYTLLREVTEERLSHRSIDPDKLRAHPLIIKSRMKEKRERRHRLHLQKSRKEAAAAPVEENPVEQNTPEE